MTGKLAMAAVALIFGVVLVLGGCVAAVTTVVGGELGAAGSGSGTSGGGEGGSAGGGEVAVPAGWEATDRAAAATCPGLPWGVLAAIGRVESDSGRSSAPGVDSGANSAGAEGPMQFEPQTFAAYATVGPGGAVPPNIYDPVDAVYTAATMLCANGGGSATGLDRAILDYNHSTAYVETVVVLAGAIGSEPALGSVPAGALAYAAAAIGTPYVWGGSSPGGFDCSGLVQAAYASAGLSLPRVAQDQYDRGPLLGASATPEPGDLVFFGTSPAAVTHVGLVIGGKDQMIDAPHTGAFVRIESYQWPDLLGATRPA